MVINGNSIVNMIETEQLYASLFNLEDMLTTVKG